jgi:hypothetical protein
MSSRDDFHVGDKVKVEFEATVKATQSHRACMEVQDDNGNCHWVYPRRDGDLIRVLKSAGPKIADGLYQDTDGELLIRRDGGWIEPASGNFRAPSTSMVGRMKLVTLPFSSEPPY